MTFQHSAENIRVDDGHILRASLRNGNGDLQDAEIDLNNHIGCVDGRFVWDGQNFSQSAENVQFNIEAGGQAAVLRASLSDSQGNREARDINLGERISNNNGSFAYN